MKRKYNHNKNLIQELYGRNFTLENLLNEQDEGVKGKFKQIIHRAKGINVRKKGEDKVSITSASADVDDTAISIDDAISQLSTELADESITDERKAQIANISAQLSKVVSGEQSAQFEEINSQAGGSSAVAGTKDKKSSSSKSSSKSGNSKVANIQKIIDPNAENTKADGKWGKGTSKAWHAWVASNIEAINNLIKDEAEKLAGNSDDSKIKAHILAERAGFTPNVAGVELLCNEISGAQSDTEDNPEAEKDEPSSDWASKRPTDVKEIIDDLNEKYPAVYDKAVQLNGYSGDVNIYKALTKNGVCPGLSTVYVKPSDEFKGTEPASEKPVADLKSLGDEDLITHTGSATSKHNAVYYDSVAKKIIYDSAMGSSNFTIPNIHLSDDKKFLFFKADEVNESFARFNGMILGKSRGQLYRERYGRY